MCLYITIFCCRSTVKTFLAVCLCYSVFYDSRLWLLFFINAPITSQISFFSAYDAICLILEGDTTAPAFSCHKSQHRTDWQNNLVSSLWYSLMWYNVFSPDDATAQYNILVHVSGIVFGCASKITVVNTLRFTLLCHSIRSSLSSYTRSQYYYHSVKFVQIPWWNNIIFTFHTILPIIIVINIVNSNEKKINSGSQFSFSLYITRNSIESHWINKPHF